MSNVQSINVNVQAAFEGFKEHYQDNNMGQDGYTEIDCIAYACEDLTELVYTAQTGKVHGPKGANGLMASLDATNALNDTLINWDENVAGWYNVYVGSFIIPTAADEPRSVEFMPRWLNEHATTMHEMGNIVIDVWTNGNGYLHVEIR